MYDAGGFAGMLMPWDADAATQAANLGKFRPNAANPTGLYLPLHGGQFFRNWVLGADGTAGGYNAPGLPEIFGTTGYDAQSGYSGAFYSGASTYGQAGTGNIRHNLSFKASLCNPSYGASDTVMPSSVNIPVIIYLGIPA